MQEAVREQAASRNAAAAREKARLDASLTDANELRLGLVEAEEEAGGRLAEAGAALEAAREESAVLRATLVEAEARARVVEAWLRTKEEELRTKDEELRTKDAHAGGVEARLAAESAESLEVENAARLAAERAESASLLVTLGEAAEAGTALEERVVVLESQLAAQVGRAGRERAREREIERERREREAREKGERERRKRDNRLRALLVALEERVVVLEAQVAAQVVALHHRITLVILKHSCCEFRCANSNQLTLLRGSNRGEYLSCTLGRSIYFINAYQMLRYNDLYDTDVW